MIRLTPGHTKGSLCIEAPQSRVVFTGDTIFDTDLGRTDLVGGSPEDMVRSYAEVIDRWPDAYTIYPGHDEKSRHVHREKSERRILQCLEGIQQMEIKTYRIGSGRYDPGKGAVLTDETKYTLEAAIERGVHVVIATRKDFQRRAGKKSLP